MARYIDVDKLIAEYDRIHVGPAGGARKLMVDAPTADVAPKSEVAREIIAFVNQLIDMQPYESRWITTSGEEMSADVGYFIEGFEIVEKEILKKYTEGGEQK